MALKVQRNAGPEASMRRQDAARPEVQGRADGRLVSELVKARLAGK